jgi:branched-chain amino acid transport system ATP-binding protein
LLEISALNVRFGQFLALHEIDMRVDKGEIVVLLGANGAGKSTLFRTISGLVRPSSGSIRFEGRELTGLRPHEIVKAGIAQGPEGKHLFPDLPVHKNLRLGAYPFRRDRRGIQASLEEVYSLFPILRQKAGQRAGSLSGGQQQMVVIARALMARPRLLLLDEPSLGLAPLVVQEVFEAILELNRRGTTVLFAEQNAYAALQVANRGYVVESGEISVAGSREELFDNPEVRRAYLGV